MHGIDFDELDSVKICARNIVKFGSMARKVVKLVLIANSTPLKSAGPSINYVNP